MSTKRLAIAIGLAVATAPAASYAQTPPPPPARAQQAQRPSPAPLPPRGMQAHVVPGFEHTLFSPELVMQHQRALALTEAQRRTISDAVKALQSQTIDVQWNLQAEQTALTELLEQRPIQEQAVTAQMNKLLELEAAVKRTHLTTLVRIKNALTDRQVQQLTELRGTGWGHALHYPVPQR